MESFNFDISQETLNAIRDMGYERPTPIQEITIQPLLSGKDLIGQAQTGTGKTAAFGIPIVEKMDARNKNTQALVLCPTRELAVQTAGEIAKLAKYHMGLRTLALYGGQPIERQLREMKLGAQVIVGTPGRIMDHMNRGSLDISEIKICVLDEADEMLDMGFRDDIESILSQTGEARQTALFSATMPLPILSLAQKYLKEPEFLKVQSVTMTVEKIKQSYIQIRPIHKAELLSRILIRDDIKRALVFLNTKIGVEDAVTQLQNRGFAAAALHGDMRQIERDAIMARFKAGSVGILVATDVAARGLDIDDVEAVINYDMPLDVEQYVHRIGRTGRAGKEGRAYTFVVGRELGRLWEYRRLTKAMILAEQPPSGEDIKSAQEARFVEKALEIASQNNNSDTEINPDANIQKLLESASAESVIRALLEMLYISGGKSVNTEIDLRIYEPPRPAQRPVTKPKSNDRPYDRKGNERGRRADDRSRPYERRQNQKSYNDKPRQGKPYAKAPKGDKPNRNFYDPRQSKSNKSIPNSGQKRGKAKTDEA